jgi:tellurite methyltransferase
MPGNASEWDKRHRNAAQASRLEPASIVRELLPLLPLGPALDLACGAGRNALLLAERHQPVTAIDWSGVALDILELRARQAHLHTRRIRSPASIQANTAGGIELLQIDLDSANLPPDSFEVILCVQYLQRSLFPQIEKALRPGGALLFETFTRAQLEFDGGPRNPAYLLESGELRKAFSSLEVLFYRELSAGQGMASLLARRPLAAQGAPCLSEENTPV